MLPWVIPSLIRSTHWAREYCPLYRVRKEPTTTSSTTARRKVHRKAAIAKSVRRSVRLSCMRTLRLQAAVGPGAGAPGPTRRVDRSDLAAGLGDYGQTGAAGGHSPPVSRAVT